MRLQSAGILGRPGRIAGLALAVVAAAVPAWAGRQRVVFRTDSRYYSIRVTDDAKGMRRLVFNRARGVQSRIWLRNPRLLQMPYARATMVGFGFVEDPKNVLVLGLGGGTIPRFLAENFPDLDLDVAEIDPTVLKVATDFFFFRTDDKRLRVHISDGRQFLKTSPKRWDLIILDAYNDDAIPFHLTTVEFLKIVKGHLNPGGAVIANIWSPDLNKLFASEIVTYRNVFKELYIFQAEDSGNYMFVAPADGVEVERKSVVERLKKFTEGKNLGFRPEVLARKEYRRVTKDPRGMLLTDDHAPVDNLRQRPRRGR
jgi:spermidine synthase